MALCPDHSCLPRDRSFKREWLVCIDWKSENVLVAFSPWRSSVAM